MNTLTSITDTPTESPETAPGIAIIYEDRATGVRAKHFSDSLLAAIGCETHRAPSCWRSELMEIPGVAAEIAREAAQSEFVILSLRGNRGLSVEMKVWIETWLAGAAGGPASLVALFDSERSTFAQAESVRCYLRHVAASADVAFFAHCAIAPAEMDGDIFPEQEEVETKPGRTKIRGGTTPYFPATAAA